MYKSKADNQKERSGFAIVLVLSALVHLALIVSLPDGDESTPNTYRTRVKARIVTPPKPQPKKVAEVKKKKVPEKKEEPKPKKEVKKEIKKEEVKKVAKKRKRKPKKRRPARRLTSKRKAPAPAAAPSAQPEVKKAGTVTDLGELDFDATDEEVNREYDPDAVEDKEPEVVAETEVKKDIPADRRAVCPKKNVKAVYPAGATAVLPARVVLTVRISANGTVESADVVSSVEAALDNEAKKALMNAKCRPAIKNGKRIASRIPFTVEYK